MPITGESSAVSGLNEGQLKSLLDQAAKASGLLARLDILSRGLLGFPYLEHPLIGSAALNEVLTLRTDGFDCVTYCETVLALAWSQCSADFSTHLKALRYQGGAVSWLERNHYMTDWLAANESKGLVVNITPRSGSVLAQKTLSTLSNYPARDRSFLLLPLNLIDEASTDWRTGDLIFFGSTRENLDVFHLGMLSRQDSGLFLRHAAKSLGLVVEEALAEFLGRNELSGVVIARPLER